MDYQTLQFKIRGVVPLLMHNGQLADPLNSHSKALAKVTGKRKKTEADHAQAAKIEWYGSLYMHGDAPCLPGEMIEAAFIEASKKHRRGQQAKAGIISDGFWPLEYDGPKAADELWADMRFQFRSSVRVQRNKIMRTRPIFSHWSATIGLDFLPDQLSGDDIHETVATMGRIVGLGDWRPRFGRFEIVSTQ
jgi:hypothetical protein